MLIKCVRGESSVVTFKVKFKTKQQQNSSQHTQTFFDELLKRPKKYRFSPKFSQLAVCIVCGFFSILVPPLLCKLKL